MSDYQTAYEAEMARLNAEAATQNGTTPAPTDAPVAPESTEAPVAAKSDDTKPAPTEAERIAALEANLASTQKALNDTKAWAHDANKRAKQLERERAAERHAASKPQVLTDNPGLEEAIQHVVGPTAKAPTAPSVDEWADTVGAALPDLDELLTKNPALQEKARALSQELGAEWMNPIVAIRELGKLQREHERNVTAEAARVAARQDFERSKQKQTAMSVPSGGTASRQPAPVDDVKRYETMSSAEFTKERAKVLGY